MSIYRGDNQNLTVNNCTIKGDFCNIKGSGNTISGDYNNIDGNNNNIKGDYNNVNGNGNNIRGDYNQHDGLNNIVSGDFNGLKGSLRSRSTTKVIASPIVHFQNGNIQISNVHNMNNSFNTNTKYYANHVSSVGDGGVVNIIHTSTDGKSVFKQTTYPGAQGNTYFHGVEKKEEKKEEKEFELPEEIKNEPDAQGDEPVCSICLERMRNTVIIDCGHSVYCVTCCRNHLKRGTQCPICRKDVQRGAIRTYQ
jgi:hypothetical protein